MGKKKKKKGDSEYIDYLKKSAQWKVPGFDEMEERDMSTKENASKNKLIGVFGGMIVAFIILVVVIIAWKCVVRIPAGYVGVQYAVNGGVKNDVLSQGWNLVAPTTEVIKYNVGLEQSYLTAESRGDSETDESFSASSSEGKALVMDLTFTYQYKPEDVVKVFKKFRGQSGVELRDSYIKPNIVSWSKEVVSRYKVADIIGTERANINNALTKYLAERFKSYGISISNVSMINVTVDDKTMEAVNNKIAAQQNAETQAIKNKTAIEKAKAKAEVKLTEAKAKANAELVEAEAEAKANQKLGRSVTDKLIKMKEAEARLKHGWVEVQGSSSTVVKEK